MEIIAWLQYISLSSSGQLRIPTSPVGDTGSTPVGDANFILGEG